MTSLIDRLEYHVSVAVNAYDTQKGVDLSYDPKSRKLPMALFRNEEPVEATGSLWFKIRLPKDVEKFPSRLVTIYFEKAFEIRAEIVKEYSETSESYGYYLKLGDDRTKLSLLYLNACDVERCEEEEKDSSGNEGDAFSENQRLSRVFLDRTQKGASKAYVFSVACVAAGLVYASFVRPGAPVWMMATAVLYVPFSLWVSWNWVKPSFF
jgi:hypothetical protein